MTTSLISMGGNLGNVAQTIDEALETLQRTAGIDVFKSSSLHRTKPVGADAGAEFVNAAAMLETSLTAHELLDRLLAIEAELGRVRTIHWGPRTLDLDLILFGDEIINDPPRLRVPHPACWYRRFVLDPLTEIAPQFVHPEKRVSVAKLQQRLLARPLAIGIVGDSAEVTALIALMQPDFPHATLRSCCCTQDIPTIDEGLLVRLPMTKPLPHELTSLLPQLSKRIGWLEAANHVTEQWQTLVDILRSVGL